ncbi:hypothetical protein GOP47_0016361 [Adiantum capillus-veneris]|uniref:Uncharacterized protein n=1 Tax=Adiantum capillus-veneris TaxID=13818 RepID=A0A9D4UHI3_ADICA|nr:hypothetical protein GOP47_0016361 [Adiantum capillus-veneris]
MLRTLELLETIEGGVAQCLKKTYGETDPPMKKTSSCNGGAMVLQQQRKLKVLVDLPRKSGCGTRSLRCKEWTYNHNIERFDWTSSIPAQQYCKLDSNIGL